MPMRCDQCCVLLFGMIPGVPWGRDGAALTDNLSTQFLLNALLIASSSEDLSGRNHSDILYLYQAPSEMGQEILRTSLWLLMWLAAQSASGGLWGLAVAGRVEAVGLRCGTWSDWMQLVVEATALLLHCLAGDEQALLTLCCGPKYLSHVPAP